MAAGRFKGGSGVVVMGIKGLEKGLNKVKLA